MHFYLLNLHKCLSKLIYEMFTPRFINTYLTNSTKEEGMYSSTLLGKNCQQDIVANFDDIRNIVVERKDKY